MLQAKQVDGFPNYVVFSDGTVYSSYQKKFLKPGDTSGRNYPRAALWEKKTSKNCRVHRLVAEAFLPSVPGKHIINHKDGDKTNNNLDNLEWCTQSENHLHAHRIGLKPITTKQKAARARNFAKIDPKGVNNGRAKLTEAQVLEIRNSDRGQKELAEQYGISPAHVWRIRTNKLWKEL